jgi:hypothetical protein
MKVRILKDCVVAGAEYKSGELADVPDDQVKGLVADGAADPAKGAVEYCEKTLSLQAETPAARATRATSELAARSEKR